MYREAICEQRDATDSWRNSTAIHNDRTSARLHRQHVIVLSHE